jgi:hypothetical protein
MLSSGERIEKVLDLIYDAAAENDLWRDVLTAIADLTNSQGGILFGVSFDTYAAYAESICGLHGAPASRASGSIR